MCPSMPPASTVKGNYEVFMGGYEDAVVSHQSSVNRSMPRPYVGAGIQVELVYQYILNMKKDLV